MYPPEEWWRFHQLESYGQRDVVAEYIVQAVNVFKAVPKAFPGTAALTRMARVLQHIGYVSEGGRFVPGPSSLPGMPVMPVPPEVLNNVQYGGASGSGGSFSIVPLPKPKPKPKSKQ